MVETGLTETLTMHSVDLQPDYFQNMWINSAGPADYSNLPRALYPYIQISNSISNLVSTLLPPSRIRMYISPQPCADQQHTTTRSQQWIWEGTMVIFGAWDGDYQSNSMPSMTPKITLTKKERNTKSAAVQSNGFSTLQETAQTFTSQPTVQYS